MRLAFAMYSSTVVAVAACSETTSGKVFSSCASVGAGVSNIESMEPFSSNGIEETCFRNLFSSSYSRGGCDGPVLEVLFLVSAAGCAGGVMGEKDGPRGGVL
jgi:hypothetical protein